MSIYYGKELLEMVLSCHGIKIRLSFNVILNVILYLYLKSFLGYVIAEVLLV